MDPDNLHAIIDRYEDDLVNIWIKEKDELFKWRAVKAWQDAFHAPGSTGTFRERFSSARKRFAFFMDNSFQHPSTGVLKLLEKEPEATERLFTQGLFQAPRGDAAAAERRMRDFLDGYEDLRIRHYPEAASYKIDPHIASVFMIMESPASHYVFRISAARKMAEYIGFGEDLGTGTAPKLVNYYEMCDGIVSALKEHASLIQKYHSCLTDSMYRDESLHLMVFDLMHCSGYRGYYAGLTSSRIERPAGKRTSAGPSAEENAKKEQERLEQIASLEKRIDELEAGTEDAEEIPLLGVAVTSPEHGSGVIVGQKVNRITVRFRDGQMDFVLEERYTKRPRFENDEEIVKAFTAYSRSVKEIADLKKKLKALR